jgi:hypothetical protein
MRILVVILLLGIGTVASAQGFLPPIGSEAQRRAETGFPPLDEAALTGAFRIEDGYFDRAGQRYRWTLQATSDLATARYRADFLGDGGRVLRSRGVDGIAVPLKAGARIEASMATPAPLDEIRCIVIRDEDAADNKKPAAEAAAGCH